MITIQKSTSGAYFTILDSRDGLLRPFMVNDYDFIPNIDGVSFSLAARGCKSADRFKIVDNEPYTNIINGDTSAVFASFAALQIYIFTNFFRSISVHNYTLPAASSSVLGGVKQGNGVIIAGDGTIGIDSVKDVTFYGAVGDGATDDTAAIQLAIDAAVTAKGGTVFFPQPSSKYLISGTLYVNPPAGTDGHSYCPITLKGTIINIKDDLLQTHGCFLYKPNAGDIIRVNIKSDGSPNLDPNAGYFSFAMDGLGFQGKTDGTTTGVRIYRTRCNLQNIYGIYLNGLIYQDHAAPAGYGGTWDNYCDQSLYRNIRMFKAALNGIVLSIPDASVIEGIYYEYPGALAQNGIVINAGSGFTLKNVLHSNGNLAMATNVGNFISITDCNGFNISGVYGETFYFGSAFYLLRCQNATIQHVTERYSSYNMLTIEQCGNIQFKNLFAWSNKVSGYSDIKFVGTASTNISWDSLKTTTYPSFAVRSNIIMNSDASLSNMNPPAFSAQLGTDELFYSWYNSGGTTFEMGNIFNGVGSARALRIGVSPTTGIPLSNASARTLVYSPTSPFFVFDTTTSGAALMDVSAGVFTASSAVKQVSKLIAPTISQSGTTPSYTALMVSPFENTVSSAGTKLLIDAGTNTAARGAGTHTSKFSVDNTGLVNAIEYKVNAMNTAPSTATSIGTVGEIRITAGFIYVCSATNTWVRAALTTF